MTFLLPIEFEAPAPIAGAMTDEQGQFALHQVPGGRTYTADVRAEGFENKLVAVTIPKESKEAVHLDPITLRPQGSAETASPISSPGDESHKVFNAVHRLDKGEVVKFIKPPFLLARQNQVIDMTRGGDHLLDYPHIIHQYRWDGDLEDGRWNMNASGHVRILTVINVLLDISNCEIDLSEELRSLHLPPGDWVVRKGATTEQKLRALEQIIAAELQRSIRFEKRQVESDTIVVTGRYKFAPLPDGDPHRLCVTAKRRENLLEHEVDSKTELLALVSSQIRIPIDDRTEETRVGKIQYLYDHDLLEMKRTTSIDKDKDLPLLLDNLAKQTGLTFTIEKQLRGVWFAAEENGGERR